MALNEQDKKNSIKLFEDYRVRSSWDKEQEKMVFFY